MGEVQASHVPSAGVDEDPTIGTTTSSSATSRSCPPEQAHAVEEVGETSTTIDAKPKQSTKNEGVQLHPVELEAESIKPDPLMQYVVIRQDLGWPLGAVVAQGCHVCVAAVSEGLRVQDECTKSYTSPENLPHMHKCVLGIPDLPKLEKLVAKLEKAPGDAPFHLWTEQPENIPVAVASWPRPKSQLQKLYRGLKLLS